MGNKLFKRQSVSEYEDEMDETEARKKGIPYKKKKKPVIQKNVKKKSENLPELPKPTGPQVEPNVDIGRLDLRVGKTIWVQPHPLKPETHYMQHTSIDSPTLSIVVSQLVEHYQAAKLKERCNVILMNLKQPLIYGLRPDGLAMCAVKDDKVELLNLPEAAAANDNIYVPGYPRNPDHPHMKSWKKIYETVCEDLRVNEDKVVVYKNVPLQIEGREGLITTNTLSDCPVKWM